MGRIGSFGRGGRAGSSMPRRPKYLSLPPPILQFRPQPLTPESTVCSVIDEEIAFETSDYISNSAPPLFSTKDDNGWITIPNRPNTPRSIYLDNLTVTDSPTKLQRLSPKYTKTSSPIWNSGKSSHNSQNSPRSTNQFSLLSDNMEDTTTTSTPSSAPDNTVSTPVTPPRERPRRKTRSPTSPSTPKKKARTPKKTASQKKTASPDLKPNYIYLTASTTSKDINTMTLDNLATEVVKLQMSADDIINLNQAKKIPVETLFKMASEIRDSLRKRHKKKATRLKIPIIKTDTLDSVVVNMTSEVANATYVSCMKKMNKTIDKDAINLLSLDDLKDGIFKYRKYLVAQTSSAVKKSTVIDDTQPAQSLIKSTLHDTDKIDKNEKLAIISQDDQRLNPPASQNSTPPSQDMDTSIVPTPTDAPDIDFDSEPLDQPPDDMDCSSDTSTHALDVDEEMSDPPDGTFSNEPPGTKPSEAPDPVVVRQHFPNDPPVTTPSKPKIQSTHADRFTVNKNIDASAFPNADKKNSVKEVQQRVVSVRAKFFKNYLNASLSDLAKTIIIKVREADPSMILVPKSDSTNDEIDNEDSFPTDDDGAKKYMTSLFQNNWVKKFTLQFRVLKTLTCIRNFVIPFMSKTKNYATVDQLSASKISCIGFLSTLNPDSHNRDNLRRICETHVLGTRHRNVSLSILPRGITHGRNKEVSESRVIVIDVSTNDAQVVSDALMEKEFTEYNSNCRFIPFLRTKKSYSSTLAALIRNHADLMKRTQRINIPDLKLKAPATFLSTDFDSIKKVLLSSNDADHPLIHDIDVAPNGSTNIMYYIEQDCDLEAYLRSLPELLSTHIDPKSIPQVYKNSVKVEKLLNQRRVTNNERKFWDEMEKNMSTNPQDPEESQTSYAAATSGRHTRLPSNSGIPQDKRLSNMEISVSALRKDYITKSDVENMLKSQLQATSIPDTVITPDTINSMIDTKIAAFSTEHPPRASSMTEQDVLELIESTTKSSQSSLENSNNIKHMIDKSITDFRAELKLTHEKLAKSILAVSTTTTNLSASITALQNQNKELTDLFLGKTNEPAISHNEMTGAKVE